MYLEQETHFLEFFSLRPYRRKDKEIVCKLRWGHFRGKVRECMWVKSTKNPLPDAILLHGSLTN